VTRPREVLAPSGEHATSNDDDFPVDLFVDEGWDDESPVPSFMVVGNPPSVLRMQRASGAVTQAHGVVKRIEEDCLILGTPGISSNEVSVGYRLPASVDLRPLIGRRVWLKLEEDPRSGGSSGQTLTIRAADDHVWLIARCGRAHDEEHSLGGAVVRMSLAPKEGGPLVVAAPDLRHIVPPGSETRMKVGASRYVVEHLSHDEGCASYFIADDQLWH
jgi:hypothetical protein